MKSSYLRFAALAVASVAAVTGFARQTSPTPAPIAPPPTAPVAAPADPGASAPVAPATTEVAKPAKKKKADGHSGVPFKGEVGAVDAKAMTLTLTGKKQDRVLHITSKSRLEKDGKPAVVADIKPGDVAHGSYQKDKEGNEVLLNASFGVKSTDTGKKTKTTKKAQS